MCNLFTRAPKKSFAPKELKACHGNHWKIWPVDEDSVSLWDMAVEVPGGQSDDLGSENSGTLTFGFPYGSKDPLLGMHLGYNLGGKISC